MKTIVAVTMTLALAGPAWAVDVNESGTANQADQPAANQTGIQGQSGESGTANQADQPAANQTGFQGQSGDLGDK